ncbi:hypothetical protein J1605_010877 [Eschrichtius robustus]|uniref:Uncharacterized protein n=1 Tax=Eschrichtius robustus TaxID=9764 RepID=A0AB34GQ10_ESCRO|nr:hypothetical protein J1605_010877 [Eschrichtius robustus]
MDPCESQLEVTSFPCPARKLRLGIFVPHSSGIPCPDPLWVCLLPAASLLEHFVCTLHISAQRANPTDLSSGQGHHRLPCRMSQKPNILLASAPPSSSYLRQRCPVPLPPPSLLPLCPMPHGASSCLHLASTPLTPLNVRIWSCGFSVQSTAMAAHSSENEKNSDHA